MTASSRTFTESELATARACLDKVVASPVFSQAERQRRFLKFIVEETLAGRVERLKGYTIGVAVFDREQSFDPAIDAIVRVEATRLRAKLREYYESEGGGDAVRFELPKGAYSVRLAWRERASEQVLQQQSTGPSHEPLAYSSAGKPAARMIDDKPSLAVLPFANMSSDPEQGYFADGIVDVLITELSRLTGLFVIARQSSFYYRGHSKRADKIGEELAVRYLLQGSVQRSGERLRITAQLVDAASGAHLWAERYDRALADIFAVQDDVVRRIVAVLQVRLAGAEAERLGHEGTAVVEAHDALLRGLERYWLFTRETTHEACAQFAKAIHMDPSYAAAHAWLARARVFQWAMRWAPDDRILEQAFEHARTAIDLDPRMPLAHVALCWAQLWRKQGDAAVAAGRRAIALDPNNADAHLFLSLSLSALDRPSEGLHAIEKGIRLNPHPSAVYQYALGQCYFVLEEYDKALTAFRSGIGLSEPFIPNHVFLCLTYTLLGREEEARAERAKVLELTRRGISPLRPMWVDEDLALRYRGLMHLAGLNDRPITTEVS